MTQEQNHHGPTTTATLTSATNATLTTTYNLHIFTKNRATNSKSHQNQKPNFLKIIIIKPSKPTPNPANTHHHQTPTNTKNTHYHNHGEIDHHLDAFCYQIEEWGREFRGWIEQASRHHEWWWQQREQRERKGNRREIKREKSGGGSDGERERREKRVVAVAWWWWVWPWWIWREERKRERGRIKYNLNKVETCYSNQESNSIPYQPVRPVFTVPTCKPVQITPLFHTRKYIGRTGEIRLFLLVNGY